MFYNIIYIFKTIIYSLFPDQTLKRKKYRNILFGINRGKKIYSELIFTQKFGLYEKKLIKEIRKICKSTDSILVLGVHNGYTLLELRDMYKTSRIFGVEASKVLCDDFKKTLKINSIYDVNLIESCIDYGLSTFGIGDNGQGMVNKNSIFSDIGNISNISQYLNTPSELNEIVTRNYFKNTDSNLLLMDIEGFEHDIFTNELPSIIGIFNFIFIEYHSIEIKKCILNYFERHFANDYIVSELEKDLSTERCAGNGHLVIEKVNLKKYK
jgi:hypothetical protein